MNEILESLARLVFKKLKLIDRQIVFVESCTGGNVAGKLVENCEGISKYLFGSYVVYNIDAKSKWLDIRKEYLESVTTESRDCACELAISASNANPTSGIAGQGAKMDAISVVGHLNDNAVIYLAYALNGLCNEITVKLKGKTRKERMEEAIIRTYLFTLEVLQ